MASKKKTGSKTKKNPVVRASITPPTATYEERAKAPKQRGLFKYREVYPGEPGYIQPKDRKGSQEIAMLPSEPDAGQMLHRPGRMGQGVVDPVEEDFIYQEYPESTHPYRRMAEDVIPAHRKKGSGKQKHGNLFRDVDALYEELDELATELKTSIDDALQSEEDNSSDTRGEHMESQFNDWLSGAADEDLLASGNAHQSIANLLSAIEDGVVDDDGEYLSRAVTVLRDRSNWDFNFGPKQRADWDETDDEVSVEFDADNVAVDVYVRNLETGDKVRLTTGEDIVLHACNVFTELEGDEGFGQEALELWLQDVVAKSDVSSVNVTWKRPKPLAGRTRVEIPNVTFTGYISVTAHARIRKPDVERELQEIVDEIENLDVAGDDVADENEQDEVSKRERIAAKSDATVQLPFTFEPVQGPDVDLVGGNWTVWNLSSADLRTEGKAMAHCAGDEGMRYATAIESGDIWIWSVRDGAGKSKFTLQVQRHGKGSDEVAGFVQVKGKGNRLPGWPYARDFPPYGPRAYMPRTEPYTESTRQGPVVHAGIKASDVRAPEVLLLWQLISQSAPLEELMKDRTLYSGPTSWEEVEALFRENSEDSYDGAQIRRQGLSLLEVFCKDMIPGLLAVWCDILFNDQRAKNPRGRRRPPPIVRLQGTTFDHPYDRFASRWMK